MSFCCKLLISSKWCLFVSELAQKNSSIHKTGSTSVFLSLFVVQWKDESCGTKCNLCVCFYVQKVRRRWPQQQTDLRAVMTRGACLLLLPARTKDIANKILTLHAATSTHHLQHGPRSSASLSNLALNTSCVLCASFSPAQSTLINSSLLSHCRCT